MNDFGFLAPGRLLLLALPLALALGYLMLQARRRRYALRFTTIELLDQVAPDRPGWRRHLMPCGGGCRRGDSGLCPAGHRRRNP
jgi:hypothetical protein